MISRLDRIRNWQDLAQGANYNAKNLANICDVSLRQLERFFLATFKKTPREWLQTLRLQRAKKLMSDRCSVKEAADFLGYKQADHFSHDFKKAYGLSPARYARKKTRTPSPP